MIWPNPPPRRSGSMVVEGREVLVNIQEFLSDEEPPKQECGSQMTPKRNDRFLYSHTSSCANPQPSDTGTDSWNSTPSGDESHTPTHRGVSAADTSRSFIRESTVSSASPLFEGSSSRPGTDESEVEEGSDDDDDDDESSKEDDEYNRVVMKVSQRDGIVTFEYPLSKEEKDVADELEGKQKEDEEGHVDQDGESSVSSGDGNDDISSNSDGSGCESEEKDELVPFELISTNIHTEEDKRQREREMIRRAVLEAAAEAYRKNHLDVPDVLVAQINENRTSLENRGRGRPSVKNFLRKKSVGHGDAATKMSVGSTDRVGRTNGKDERFSSNHKPSSRTNSKEPSALRAPDKKEKHQSRVQMKKIKLRREDEIHASPCQCALRLIGMRSLRSPPNSANNLFGSMKASSARSFFGNTLSFSEEAVTAVPPTRSQSSRDVRSGKMVYTASARAADPQHVERMKNLGEKSRQGANPSVPVPLATLSEDGSPSLQLGGPPETVSSGVTPKVPLHPSSSQHARFDSCAFESIGYHEVTLVRCGKSTEASDFVPWDAVTIRCADHDAMDVLISALRVSSKAKVVPFSSDPKAKLKKKENCKNGVRRKRRRSRKRRGESGCGSAQSKVNSAGASMVAGETSPEKRSSPSKRPSEPKKTPFQRKKRHDSKKWNKADHCELCGFHFTLLTRRHHCRKCDRSCCGDCSSVLVVRGGDETRYCNSCSAVILRKQSRALHRRTAEQNRRMPSAVIPGKVHHECRRLGVGVLGKLPHWKNYLALQSEDRPAVGRVTVEVIEALALPTADVNGKADPYVRATITGYDRDLRWNMKEWLSKKRYSLCSVYSSATLSPVWRGSGGRGGELLTLPVISTAGAVLRLEVLHYDVMTNSRGKDKVLGLVEIPLSDIPNANLRRPDPVSKRKSQNNASAGAGKKMKKLSYDGFCDRWYRLLCNPDLARDSVVSAKPIHNPQTVDSVRDGTASVYHRTSTSESVSGKSTDSGDDNRNRSQTKQLGIQSLHEIGQRVQGFCVAPVEWIGSALDIDLPRRRPETVCEEHKTRSAIHVRIKLNASEVGDLMSHTWFPPVRPIPEVPPFDPQTLFTKIVKVEKKIRPYLNLVKFVEDAIKWHHPPKTCVVSYFVLAVHIIFMQYFLFLAHFYLLIFFWLRLREMTSGESLQRLDSLHSSEAEVLASHPFDSDLTERTDPNKEHSKLFSTRSAAAEDGVFGKSPSECTASSGSEELNAARTSHRSLTLGRSSMGESSLSVPKSRPVDRRKRNSGPAEEDEDSARLSKAVSWIAKRLGDNRGLEILQFKLELFERDVANVNSLWDGSSSLKTRTAIVVVAVSLVTHCFFDARLLWVCGTATLYFGSSPFAVRCARSVLGAGRGTANIIRRRHLHELEVSRQSKHK